jgi:hypothetical protein
MKFFQLTIQYFSTHLKGESNRFSTIRYAKTEKELQQYIVEKVNREIAITKKHRVFMQEMREVHTEWTPFIRYNRDEKQYYLTKDAPDELVKDVHDYVTMGMYLNHRWTYEIVPFEIVGDCEDFIVNGASQNRATPGKRYREDEEEEAEDAR